MIRKTILILVIAVGIVCSAKLANSSAKPSSPHNQVQDAAQAEADWDTARDLCIESHNCSMLYKMERGE